MAMMEASQGFGMRRAPAVPATQSPNILLIVFFVSLLVPIALEPAGVRVTPDRFLMLICFLPSIVHVLSGKAGRFTLVDLLFLMFGGWMVLSLTINHGISRTPFAIISAVELLGGYFLGRVLIKDAQGYLKLIRFLVISLVILTPFAIYESITGKLVIPDLLRPIFDTPSRNWSAYGRMGLERVYTVFEHPILWGLFCSFAFANTVMLLRQRFWQMAPLAVFVFYLTFTSLSSAPLLACGVQIILLAWAWIMKGKWNTLLFVTIFLYVVVDALSNRTPVTILIETLTFNANTGWARINIFNYGWAAVVNNPIFGIGFNDWPRPFWLTSSVDNFWLLMAMRYGLPAASLVIGAFVLHIWFLTRAKIKSPQIAAIRVAHAITLISVLFTLITVHIWGNVSVFVTFFLGAGAWMYVFPQTEETEAEKPETGRAPSSLQFSRFTSRDNKRLQRPAKASDDSTPKYSRFS